VLVLEVEAAKHMRFSESQLVTIPKHSPLALLQGKLVDEGAEEAPLILETKTPADLLEERVAARHRRVIEMDIAIGSPPNEETRYGRKNLPGAHRFLQDDKMSGRRTEIVGT
jgi:hypothetical protein